MRNPLLLPPSRSNSADAGRDRWVEIDAVSGDLPQRPTNRSRSPWCVGGLNREAGIPIPSKRLANWKAKFREVLGQLREIPSADRFPDRDRILSRRVRPVFPPVPSWGFPGTLPWRWREGLSLNLRFLSGRRRSPRRCRNRATPRQRSPRISRLRRGRILGRN